MINNRSKAVTIIKIAEKSGFSKSTVSLALQHSPKIKKSTRKKILKVARELGYVYNRSAANLRKPHSNLIGLVINDLTNPFFSELAVAIEQELGSSGYVVVLVNTSENIEKQEQVIRSLSEHNVKGVIVCPALGTPNNFIGHVNQYGMAMVTVARPIPHQKCDFISVDGDNSIFLTTEHIIAQGARNLAFVGGEEGNAAFEHRLAGFHRAIKNNQAKVDSFTINPCAINRNAASKVTQSLLATEPQPDGIICYSDLVAFGVYSGIQRCGKRVGIDIAVTGMDNIQGASDVHPSLTTTEVFIEAIGKRAAEVLLKRLSAPEIPFSNYSISAELLIRESSSLSGG